MTSGDELVERVAFECFAAWVNHPDKGMSRQAWDRNDPISRNAWMRVAAAALQAGGAPDYVLVPRSVLEFYADPRGKCDQVPDFYSELGFGDLAQEALAAPRASGTVEVEQLRAENLTLRSAGVTLAEQLDRARASATEEYARVEQMREALKECAASYDCNGSKELEDELSRRMRLAARALAPSGSTEREKE